jgi:heparan-alpha-glucosaminide N-acetyltransferase
MRLRSLDALRGLTILVMVFVNDLAGVAGVPAWMKHVPRSVDGMTFVDVVFPAFLFIVGAAIPLALDRRLALEDGQKGLWRHVLGRTLGLVAIGLLMASADAMGEDGRLSPALWSLLLYLGVFLTWNAGAGQRARVLRLVGLALLVLLMPLYRGEGPASFIELRPTWWGILGLIGWAYLVACAVYVAVGRSLTGLVAAIPLLYCLYIADAAGAFGGWSWLAIGSTLGSHAAVVVTGAAFGVVLGIRSSPAAQWARVAWCFAAAAALAVAAELLHAARGIDRMFIINKILATPPWCLWSSALTLGLWLVLYLLVDVRQGSADFLETAGQNALTAYLLAPVLESVFALSARWTGLPNLHETLGVHFASGLFRSAGMAVLVAWLAAVMRRRGLWLAL